MFDLRLLRIGGIGSDNPRLPALGHEHAAVLFEEHSREFVERAFPGGVFVPAGLEIGLEAVDMELAAVNRAILHPRVEAFDLVAKPQFEVGELAPAINQESV